jgi:hypothetical protein
MILVLAYCDGFGYGSPERASFGGRVMASVTVMKPRTNWSKRLKHLVLCRILHHLCPNKSSPNGLTGTGAWAGQCQGGDQVRAQEWGFCRAGAPNREGVARPWPWPPPLFPAAPDHSLSRGLCGRSLLLIFFSF